MNKGQKTIWAKEKVTVARFIRLLVAAIFFLTLLPSPAARASFTPFNTSVNMNVGIGTSTPQGALTVVNGNVGIGTWTTAGGNLIVRGTGNVGIGSAWPGKTLDVNGAVRSTTGGFFFPDGTSLTTANNASNYWTLQSSGNIGISTVQNVGIGTTFVGGAGEGALSVMNGNVGIGTWVPGALLSVNGAINTNKLQVDSADYISLSYQAMDFYLSSGQHMMSLNASPNKIFLMQAAIGADYFYGNNPTNGLAIEGNVGIGSTVPYEKLGIVGNVGIGTVSYSSFVGATPDANGMIVEGNVGIGTTKNSTAGLSVMNGNVGIGTWIPGGELEIAGNTNNLQITRSSAASTNGVDLRLGVNGDLRMGAIDSSNNAGGGAFQLFSNNSSSFPGQVYFDAGNNAGSSIVFRTGNNGTGFAAAEKMRIANSGNVGIGTAVPFDKLSIVGNVGIGTISYSNFVAQAPDASGLIVEGNVGIGTTKNSTAGLSVMNGNVGIGTWIVDSGGLIVASGAGNVGIGTIRPGTALDVNGKIRSTTGGFVFPDGSVLTTANNASNYWTLQSSGNIGISTVQNVGIGTTFVGGAGEGALSIMNGNVGIGTWVPVNSLDLNGTMAVGASYSGVRAAPSNGMAVQGNIGIGTWLPQGTLDVGGILSGSIYLGNGTGGSLQFIGSASTGSATINNANTVANAVAGDIQYQSRGVNTVVFKQSGNVGIGTILPYAKLAVAGNVGIGTVSYSSYVGVVPSGNGMIVEGNVGIGTTINNQGSLVVMPNNLGNGNVGIGTWVPGALLAFPPGTTSALGISFGGDTDLYRSGSGNLTTDTTLIANTFFANTNAVSPAVYGGISASNNLTIDSTSNGTKGTIRIAPSGGNVGIGTNTAVGGLAIMNGNVGIGTWIVDSGGFIVASGSGNVGIATIRPGTALDVNGTVRMTGFNIASGAGSNKVLTSDANGNGTWAVAGAGSNYWLTDTGNVGINTSYNVGIGTISQNNALNIVGNVGIGTIVYSPFVTGAPGANGVIIEGNVGIGTTKNSTAGLTVMNGNVGIGTWVAGDGLIVMNGNVGIKTIKPLALLDLRKDPLNTAEPLAFNGAAAGDSHTVFAITGATNNLFEKVGMQFVPSSLGEGQNYSLGGIFGQITNTGGANIEGDLTIDMRYNTNNTGLTEMIRIKNTGNVGIGTLSPLSKFVVNGGVGIGTTVTNNAYLSVNTAPSGGLIVQSNVGIGTFNPFGGGLIILPANTGNVGIGSLAPGTALDVNGTARMTGFAMASGASNNFVLTSDANGNGTWAVAGAGSNYWLTDTGNVGINTSYNVGIGTISQVNGLNILGNIGIGTMKGDSYLTTAAPNGGAIIYGNVGIGTWVPAQMLDVVNNQNGQTNISVSNSNSGSTALAQYMMNGSGSNQATFGLTSSGYTVNQSIQPNQLYFYSTGSKGLDFIANSASAPIVFAPGGLAEKDRFDGNGNLGLGTTTPAGALTVMNGNVGIGTWVPAGLLQVAGTGNVGIGSTAPGVALDVSGGVRMTAFTLSSGPVNNYVLTSDASGNGTWQVNNGASGSNYWKIDTGNVGINTSYNIGIGTISQNNSLGIQGNIGVGTVSYSNYLITTAPNGGAIFEGNVGIGTFRPVSASLSVMGGNVGIGTSTPQGAFTVTNGNVGIGTWVPTGLLQVVAALVNSPFLIDSNGNVGIGTIKTTAAGLSVMTGNVGIGTWVPGGSLVVQGGNVGIGTTNPGQLLDINNGRARFVGIGTTVAGTILCLKTDGTVGYCTGTVSGYQCGTCN